QAHPPDAQPRQPRKSAARKRRPVVAANSRRQPVLDKRAREARAGGLVGAMVERVTAEDKATERVAQRERIAIHAIAGAEFPFEIRGPPAVRRRDRRQWRRRRRDRSAPAVTRDQPGGREAATHRRATRPVGIPRWPARRPPTVSSPPSAGGVVAPPAT